MTQFPDVVRIEPAGRCNFHCIHCPTGTIGNGRYPLRIDDFKRIFDSLPLIPRVLVLYHGGEPLLSTQLEQMIEYAKENGVKKIVLNTNAGLLTIERGLSLAAAGLDEMRVSFDGKTAQENDTIRRGSDFREDASIVKQLALRGLSMRIVIYNVQISGGEKTEPAQYLTDYFGDLVEYRTDPARVWASLPNQAHIERAPEQPTYCPNLFETFTIMSNGQVVKCCEDLLGEETHGDVRQYSPLEIWDKMQAYRDAFKRREYSPLCSRCYRVTGAYLV